MRKLLLCLGLSASLILAGGCASTALNTYKAEVVVVTTVDTGMHAWSDYVKAGHATQAQVDLVHTGYNKYYEAQLLVKAAMEAYANSKTPGDTTNIALANKSAEDAKNALLDLLQSILSSKH